MARDPFLGLWVADPGGTINIRGPLLLEGVLGIEGISDNEESGTYSINSYITDSSSSFNPSIDGDQQQRQAQTQAQQTQIQQVPVKPLLVGNSSELEIGDRVVAIGYPFGTDSTMTSGIVGQTNYLLEFPTIGFSVPDTIVTDISINPGNSGGPLINERGEVIGIIYGRINPTGAPLGQFPGLTVGIPSSIISSVVPVLIENGTYTHPATGIVGSTLTINFAQRHPEIPQSLEGVVVKQVVKGSTADLAGIESTAINKYGEETVGDIIMALDDRKIAGIEELISYVQNNKDPGQYITFTVYRDGVHRNLNSTVQPLE